MKIVIVGLVVLLYLLIIVASFIKQYRKIVIVVAFLVFFGLPVHAEQEVKIKTGYINILCKPVHDTGVVELAYEVKNKSVGIEVFGQGFITKIDEVGDVTSLNYGITPKIYLPFGFYFGLGIGYMNNFAPKGMDIDDEVQRYGIIGKNFGGWGIEFKRIIADLDIETHLPYETDIEKRSRLDNWQVVIVKKF